MNALINATVNDMKKAEHAMLRMVNDQYRKTIFRAHVMANSGAFTLKQSIDAATKDFLKAGINCIEYKDGRRVNIATYAEMAVRTANKRAVLQSEGEARDAYGVHTVRISKYGGCSETCLPWQGRIYVDDIWSGGTKEEANEKNLPLLSEAVESGLFHPNCKHRATTYFYDLEKSLEDQDEEGLENPLEEQEHRKNHLHIQQQERLETGSLDSKNVAEAKQRKDAWIEKDKSLDYGTYLESPLKIDSSDIDSINMYKVNNIVNKKEYHDKFEQLPFSKSTREGLYKESINLLKLRNGTDFESAYAINYRTGEFLISTSTNEKLMSAFTKYELDIVNECSDGVIIIHNHPLGGRLSMGDLRTLYKQKNCKAMFSIGHNGDIFGCLFNNKLDFKKVDKFYEDVYNMYVNMYGNKTDAEIFALDDVYKSFDLLTINLLERG